MLCFKTLYDYLDNAFISINNTDLAMKLKYNLKSYKVLKNKNNLDKSIELRAKDVKPREEFGYLEIDTVIGLKSKYVYFLSSFFNRYLVLFKIS